MRTIDIFYCFGPVVVPLRGAIEQRSLYSDDIPPNTPPGHPRKDPGRLPGPHKFWRFFYTLWALVLCACVILREKAGYYESVMLPKHVTRPFRV